jgi:hypothetical protein
MRTAAVFVFFLSAVTVALGQKSEVRKVEPFKGIKAQEAINVVLKKGDKESVRVEAENVPLNAVITEVSGNYLRIRMAEGSYKNRRVRVEVTYVTLERISASSASSVVSEGPLQTTSLDISGSSAASIELTQLTVSGTVTVDVSSAGDIILEGKAKSLRVEASSAGVVDAYNLECESVDASAGSAGNVKVNVTKSLRADASSAGSIRYRGNPTNTDTNSSSGGSVKKTN